MSQRGQNMALLKIQLCDPVDFAEIHVSCVTSQLHNSPGAIQILKRCG